MPSFSDKIKNQRWSTLPTVTHKLVAELVLELATSCSDKYVWEMCFIERGIFQMLAVLS